LSTLRDLLPASPPTCYACAPLTELTGTQSMRSESVLEHLLSEGIISEVLGRLQSGKEAEVFVVRCQGNVVAAKVYKDRAQRSFKNNSSYKEGRSVRNSRSQRAMERGSKYGKEAAEDAWKSAEVDALYRLHAAEVRVPTPVMYFEGVLLMELVLDAAGNTAPRLIDVALTPEQANAGYHDMLTQLVRMLNCELIHGDLSPYNVLWAAAGPTVIDFPQIVSAAQNTSSERFFLRDAENILGHFARIDRSLRARSGDAFEIWRAYTHRELTPDFRPTGRVRPPAPRPPAPPPRAPEWRAPTPRAPEWRGQANAPRSQGPSGRAHGPGPGPGQRQSPPRPSGDPRRAARPPEVLLARPRRPGADAHVQVTTRPAPRPASPPHGRPASPQAPRAEPSRGSGENSDRSSHRRRPRRRS
jgi:RIO kinase 1